MHLIFLKNKLLVENGWNVTDVLSQGHLHTNDNIWSPATLLWLEKSVNGTPCAKNKPTASQSRLFGSALVRIHPPFMLLVIEVWIYLLSKITYPNAIRQDISYKN